MTWRCTLSAQAPNTAWETQRVSSRWGLLGLNLAVIPLESQGAVAGPLPTLPGTCRPSSSGKNLTSMKGWVGGTHDLDLDPPLGPQPSPGPLLFLHLDSPSPHPSSLVLSASSSLSFPFFSEDLPPGLLCTLWCACVRVGITKGIPDGPPSQEASEGYEGRP